MSRAHMSFPTWKQAVIALQAYVPTSQREIKTELDDARAVAHHRNRGLAGAGAAMLLVAIAFQLLIGPIFIEAPASDGQRALGYFLRIVAAALGATGVWFLLPSRRATAVAQAEQDVLDRFGPARGPDLVIVNDLVSSSVEARDVVRGWLDMADTLSAEDVQMLLLTYDAWLAERVRQRVTDTDRSGIAALADSFVRQAPPRPPVGVEQP